MNEVALFPYYKNEDLEALQDENWIFVRWVTNDKGYLSKNFIKTLKQLERIIREENLEGWYCESDKEHTTMHKIIEKFGCHLFFEENGKYFFRKFLKREAEPCAAEALVK